MTHRQQLKCICMRCMDVTGSKAKQSGISCIECFCCLCHLRDESYRACYTSKWIVRWWNELTIHVHHIQGSKWLIAVEARECSYATVCMRHREFGGHIRQIPLHLRHSWCFNALSLWFLVHKTPSKIGNCFQLSPYPPLPIHFFSVYLHWSREWSNHGLKDWNPAVTCGGCKTWQSDCNRSHKITEPVKANTCVLEPR